MTGPRPTDQRPQPTPEGGPAPDPAIERANRLSAANMLRSLLPIVVIILAVVGWQAFRQGPDEQPVKPVDPSSTEQLAASRAGYPLLVPTGLPAGYRPTSARTDAGGAGEGDPVTLQIGYVTPSDRYAGFVISDDASADPLTAALDGARGNGTVDVGGTAWDRSTTQRGETALRRTADGVTVLVTGSASLTELETVAGSLRPYSG
jgi:hypothetical protein